MMTTGRRRVMVWLIVSTNCVRAGTSPSSRSLKMSWNFGMMKTMSRVTIAEAMTSTTMG